MTNLTEISGRVDAKLQEIKTVLDKTRDSQTPKSEIPTLTERFRALDAELNDLKSQEEVLKAADATEKEIKARSEATNLPNISRPEGGQRTVKSLAEMILEIPGFKENAKKAEKDLDQNLGRQITDYNYVAGFKSRGLKANTL